MVEAHDRRDPNQWQSLPRASAANFRDGSTLRECDRQSFDGPPREKKPKPSATPASAPIERVNIIPNADLDDEIPF
jgi:hypothetical protein